jgi:hypothetical protein
MNLLEKKSASPDSSIVNFYISKVRNHLLKARLPEDIVVISAGSLS